MMKKQVIIGEVIEVNRTSQLCPYVQPNIVIECLAYIRKAQITLMISNKHNRRFLYIVFDFIVMQPTLYSY